MDSRSGAEVDEIEIEGPAITRFLFSNSRAGLIWLPIRLFLGFSWMAAGWHKATGGGWLDGGTALQGYWTKAVAVPDTGSPAITYDWWRNFLQFLLDKHAYSWFAYVVTFGELLVGVGPDRRRLTGVAAFFGSFMNMSFMLSGSASSNPILFFLAIGVILAWKVAGYYGVDRWLLPVLGTPWRPGRLAVEPAPRAGSLNPARHRQRRPTPPPTGGGVVVTAVAGPNGARARRPALEGARGPVGSRPERPTADAYAHVSALRSSHQQRSAFPSGRRNRRVLQWKARRTSPRVSAAFRVILGIGFLYAGLEKVLDFGHTGAFTAAG